MSAASGIQATIPAGGECDRRFEDLRAVFAENFTLHDQLGAAVCASIHGEPVVDLWGGHADIARSRPWQRDTLVNTFSVTKGPAALCALILVDRGELDLDAPVSRYWPAFAAQGKDRCTVREVLCHKAGLPAVREPLPAGALYDWDRMCDALARQAPWWQPGSRHGYHVNTFGFLVGELVRRVSGSSLGAFLRDTVTDPLGADFHIGLPATEEKRVADFDWPATMADPQLPPESEGMAYKTYFNPHGLSGHGTVNTRAWRAAEIPSGNGCGTARGIARVYAALAADGVLDGTRLLGGEILAEAAGEHAFGPDAVLGGRETRFGLGFQLPQNERLFGPTGGGFGHFGAGGSVGFCDPEVGLAFAYVTNRMGPRWQSPSARRLIDTLYELL